MQIPLEIRMKDLELPPGVEAEIREKAGKLERFYDRITRCRVTVTGPGKHHRKGHYEVTVDFTVPGIELVVHKQDSEELHIALREAFDAAVRRLEDHVRRRRGFVKNHAPRT
jgi:ribosomal subunit interface protein